LTAPQGSSLVQAKAYEVLMEVSSVSNTVQSPYTDSGHGHGIWRLGILLMRRQRFAFKAAIICTVFLIPILVLATYVLLDKYQAIASTQKEQLGLEYVRVGYEVLKTGQAGVQLALANEQSALANAKQELDTAVKKLGELEASRSPILGTGKAFADLLEKHKALDSVGDGLPRFAAYRRFQNSVVSVHKSASDGSGYPGYRIGDLLSEQYSDRFLAGVQRQDGTGRRSRCHHFGRQSSFATDAKSLVR
jgi:hypothetical protein